MLTSILQTTESPMTLANAALCSLTSIAIGVLLALVYNRLYKDSSRSYIISLIILPFIVQMVIMLVNGNLGTGVAVAGAFTLVRFRSMPGTAREICGIFCAMVTGLATGMGYLGVAAMIAIVVCLIFVVVEKLGLGRRPEPSRMLRITIPEDIDYTDVFDDLFAKYTTNTTLDKVRTTNMGSMYELTYSVDMKDDKQEKEFIDAIRCRNGNLTISMGRPETVPVQEL